MPERTFTISASHVEVEQRSGNVVTRQYFDPSEVVLNFSQQAYIDTGLLPLEGTGLLAYRQAGDYQQFLFQIAPQVERVIWGAFENDDAAKTYFLAKPYYIFQMDVYKSSLLGARHFYSPDGICHLEQPLYHCNLPNTNCRGYRHTGVGWVCLYHKQNWNGLKPNEMLQRGIERMLGGEAYNDANMSETDGPRFYMEHRPQYPFLFDAEEWQHKTQSEGIDWTLNPDLWVPVLVTNIDNQSAHDPTGIPLTVEMLMTGRANSYYTDVAPLKPINHIARDHPIAADTLAQSMLRSVGGLTQIPAPIKPRAGKNTKLAIGGVPLKAEDSPTYIRQRCAWSKQFLAKDEQVVDTVDGPVKARFIKDHYGQCAATGRWYRYQDLIFHDDGKWYAKSTGKVTTCPTCGATYLDNLQALNTEGTCTRCANTAVVTG